MISFDSDCEEYDDEDYEGCGEDTDVGYDLSKSKHVDTIRKDAIEYMKLFFIGKEFWAGGPIPNSRLFNEKHVKTVMELRVADALVVAYYCLERNTPDTVNTKEKTWDIQLCYECLNQCAARLIPKCFAGGMVLVYLCLCHGVNYIPVLEKLNELRALIRKKEKEEEISKLQTENKRRKRVKK